MSVPTLTAVSRSSTPPAFSPFPIVTVYGCSILGHRRCWIVVGPHGNLLSCESTYGAACDCLSRLAMAHRRWVHQGRWYQLKARNWKLRKGVSV